jgi:hypothetical protein
MVVTFAALGGSLLLARDLRFARPPRSGPVPLASVETGQGRGEQRRNLETTLKRR